MTHYWHFVQVDNNGTPRLGYGDGREVKVGETLRVEGTPVLCRHGLHASAKLWDALCYASSNNLALCRVTLGGDVLHDSDKSVGNERTVIAMIDSDTTEKLLREWARWCALQVIHLWNAPDMVRQYLKTGDESLRAAASAAAWAAAWAAPLSAASAAALSAARAAAWDADAARDAARDAASDAASAAASAAAIKQYADELERRGLAALHHCYGR